MEQNVPLIVFKFGNGKTKSTCGCISLWMFGVKVFIHVLETPTYVPILLGMDFMENIHAQIELAPGRGSLSVGQTGQKELLRVLGKKHRALRLVGS